MKMYTKKVLSAANFSNMRGVTDFSNAAQFNLYEKGYSHLFVINGPKYIDMLAKEKADSDIARLYDTFLYILEYEFKGLDGIGDISVDNLEVTDNISTLNVIGKVTKPSAAEVSMTYTEKSGSAITNFIKYYLEGIKDPRTQAKTYHGLIKSGKLAGGFENEVFNLMYIVTDNTMLQVEKSYLLCNAWPNGATTSIYESTKGEIDKADIQITWNCFLIDGPEIDKHAVKILAAFNETGAVANAMDATGTTMPGGKDSLAALNTQNITDPHVGTVAAPSDKTIHLQSMVDKDEGGFIYSVANSEGKLDTFTSNTVSQ